MTNKLENWEQRPTLVFHFQYTTVGVQYKAFKQKKLHMTFSPHPFFGFSAQLRGKITEELLRNAPLFSWWSPPPASRLGKTLGTSQLPPGSRRRCERCVDYSYFCRAYTPPRPAPPHFTRTLTYTHVHALTPAPRSLCALCAGDRSPHQAPPSSDRGGVTKDSHSPSPGCLFLLGPRNTPSASRSNFLLHNTLVFPTPPPELGVEGGGSNSNTAPARISIWH